VAVNKDLMRLIASGRPVPPEKYEKATFDFDDSDLFGIIEELVKLEEQIKSLGLVVPRRLDTDSYDFSFWKTTDSDYGDRAFVSITLHLEKTPERLAQDKKKYEEDLIKWQRSMENTKEERAELFQEEVAALAKKYGLEESK
jgi:hypothetical protein